MFENIENIDLGFLTINDYKELKIAGIPSCPTMPDSYCKKNKIKFLLEKFPKDQVIIKTNNQMAGCTLSTTVNYNAFDELNSYKDITSNSSLNTHKPDEDVLYGIFFSSKWNKSRSYHKYRNDINSRCRYYFA